VPALFFFIFLRDAKEFGGIKCWMLYGSWDFLKSCLNWIKSLTFQKNYRAENFKNDFERFESLNYYTVLIGDHLP
jgi:hypothetical protein